MSVFILIPRGFKENGSRQEKNKMQEVLYWTPHWEDLNKLVSYVFAKVMVTYVDVLGTRVP